MTSANRSKGVKFWVGQEQICSVWEPVTKVTEEVEGKEDKGKR